MSPITAPLLLSLSLRNLNLYSVRLAANFRQRPLSLLVG
jgi:hypothetical protein